MPAYPYLPGVPAAGHINGGTWHPGATSTCRKGSCAPPVKRGPCYHVACASGQVYGVAANTVRQAMEMVQDRLTAEGSDDRPVRAKCMSSWDAPYGTVLAY